MILPDRKKHSVLHLLLASPQFDARVSRAQSVARNMGLESHLVAHGENLAPPTFSLAHRAYWAATFRVGGTFGAKAATAAYRVQSVYRAMSKAALEFTPSIIHANDWDTLPIAASIAKRTGARLLYDSHEFAPDMHRERRLWNFAITPALRLIEQRFILDSDQVITVSDGLAALLQKTHDLPQMPLVIRNMPDYVDTRPMENQKSSNNGAGSILLHYHGVIADGRGLMEAIELLDFLPPHHRLRIVGPVRSESYVKKLKAQILKRNLSDRVDIMPPVPFQNLVKMAAEADFGLCILPVDSDHNDNALPNKLFEYQMAGLTPIIANSRAMSSFCRQQGAAIDISDMTWRGAASLICEISADDIRQNAVLNRATALQNNWDIEKDKLVCVYENLLRDKTERDTGCDPS